MKRYLDEIFNKHLEEGGFVLAADVGFFPRARKHKNFIDVGNNESCVGSVAEGLLADGKNVFIYDICGYILKNSYASLYARNNQYHPKKGKLTVFGWGSGFSYDGCMLGHYPTDDVMLSRLLGLNDWHPSTQEDIDTLKYNWRLFNQGSIDLYIRLYDISKHLIYKKKPCNPLSDLIFVSHGWILGYLQKLAINGFWGEKTVSIVNYMDFPVEYRGQDNVIYLTDQIKNDILPFSSFVRTAISVNEHPIYASKCVDMKSCLENWWNLKETT